MKSFAFRVLSKGLLWSKIPQTSPQVRSFIRNGLVYLTPCILRVNFIVSARIGGKHGAQGRSMLMGTTWMFSEVVKAFPDAVRIMEKTG